MAKEAEGTAETIIRLSTGANQAHLAVFAKDQGNTKLRVLGTYLAGHAAEGAPRRRDEIVSLPLLPSIFHVNPSIVLSWLGEQVVDSAMSLGGLIWLSQTAQRSASNA